MAKKNTPGIYGIHCTANGKWYVGASIQMERRLKDHERDLRDDSKNYRLYGDNYNFKYKGEMGRDYAVFGKKCFRFVVLEVVTNLGELEKKERSWVKKLSSHAHGYNHQAVGRNRHWGKS